MSSYEREQVKRFLSDGITPNKIARMLGLDVKEVHRVAEGMQCGQR